MDQQRLCIGHGNARVCATLLATGLLVACQTTKEATTSNAGVETTRAVVGQGALTLAPGVYESYLNYLAPPDPATPPARKASIVFVVSADGNTATWANGSRGHGRGNEHAEMAVKTCEERSSKQCYVFAYGRYVAWQGPVYVEGREKPIHTPPGASSVRPSRPQVAGKAAADDSHDGIYVAAKCGFLGEGIIRIKIRDGEIESLTREIEISSGGVDAAGWLIGFEYSTGSTARSGRVEGSLYGARFVPAGEMKPGVGRTWTDNVKPCTTSFARVSD